MLEDDLSLDVINIILEIYRIHISNVTVDMNIDSNEEINGIHIEIEIKY